MSKVMTDIHRNTDMASTKTAVIVLGMHRSGTSALSRTLNLLGCDNAKTLMPATSSNAEGFWESAPISKLNDDIFSSAGGRWDEWQEFNPNWIKSSTFHRFLNRGVETIGQEFGNSFLFVMKDPRICVLFPFWRAVMNKMGIKPVVVHTVRHPQEVIESLQKRDHHSAMKAALLWLRYNIAAENFTRDLPCYFTSYETLLKFDNDFIENSQSALDIYWPRNSNRVKNEITKFLSEASRHHRYDPDDMSHFPPYIADLLGKSYSVFNAWAEKGCRNDTGMQKLDEISREFARQTPVFERIVAEINVADAKIKDLSGKIQQSEASVAAAIQERSEFEKQTVALTRERDEAKAQSANFKEALEEIQHKEAAYVKNERDLKWRVEELSVHVEQQADEITRFRGNAISSQEEKVDAERKIDQAAAQSKLNEQEIINLTIELDNRMQRISDLEKRLIDMKAALNSSGEVEQHMQEAVAKAQKLGREKEAAERDLIEKEERIRILSVQLDESQFAERKISNESRQLKDELIHQKEISERYLKELNDIYFEIRNNETDHSSEISLDNSNEKNEIFYQDQIDSLKIALRDIVLEKDELANKYNNDLEFFEVLRSENKKLTDIKKVNEEEIVILTRMLKELSS